MQGEPLGGQAIGHARPERLASELGGSSLSGGPAVPVDAGQRSVRAEPQAGRTIVPAEAGRIAVRDRTSEFFSS